MQKNSEKSTLRAKIQLEATYQQKQQTIKKFVQKLAEQSEQAHQKIIKECTSLKQQLKKLSKKVQQYLKACENSLEDESINHFIGLNQVTQYFKSQKQFLKDLTNEQKQDQQNTLDLNQLSAKIRLQENLRKLRKKKLELEIAFLQQNVLVKDIMVYNSVQTASILLSQDKQLNSRLQNAINELQRVIKLSEVNLQRPNNSSKIKLLDQQQQRLRRCQELINKQRDLMNRTFKHIEGQQLQLILRVPQIDFKSIKYDNESKLFQNELQLENVNEFQLQKLLDFNFQTVKLINRFQHPFTEIQQGIDQLRNKITKKNLLS